MAGNLTNYAEDQVLKWLTGNAITATTGGITAKLLSGSPESTDTALASVGTQSLTAGTWSSGTSGTSTVYTYGADLTFLSSNANTVTAWGVGLYAGANMLSYTDFISTKQLSNGESLVIPNGTLKLQLD